MAAPILRLTAFRVSLFAVTLAAVGVVGWNEFFQDNPQGAPPNPPDAIADELPPDPRLAFVTPFRNVKPDIQYVGDATCAACHRDIDKKYHAHPMGRSAEFVSKATPIERYDAAAHNPVTAGPYELRVESDGDTMVHRARARDSAGKMLPDYVTIASLAIGSGTRGRSYVCVEQGAAWQTSISWFSPSAKWDVSPGFDLGDGGRRPVVAGCLFCHVNRVEPVPLSVNRYREPFPSGQVAIGCERCHGPGELHVTERTAGRAFEGIDTSIVSPKHLSADLRDGICAQCHLQAEQRVVRRGRDLNDFRPGLPLEQFVASFVRHPDLADLRRSVGQFEQMHESRCYTESTGRLGCTTCHDPHAKPPAVTQDKFYNDRCLTCHGSDSKRCSEQSAARKAKDNSCLACHMPRTGSSNIVHASVTDHRIPRTPSTSSGNRRLTPSTIPLVPFRIGSHGPSAQEHERDLGIALARVIASVPAQDGNSRTMIGSLAEERLKTSLSKWRGDVPAWTALAVAREARGDPDGALEAALTACTVAPASEEARGYLVSAAAAAGKFDTAIEAATELIRMSPSSVEPLILRAGVFIRQREWQRAEVDCRAALAIHPLHPLARLFLAICRHHQGDRAGGRREADTAAGLTTKPQLRTALLDLYLAQTR